MGLDLLTNTQGLFGKETSEWMDYNGNTNHNIQNFSKQNSVSSLQQSGTPRGINFAEVREAFFQVEGILDIHNLRVWSLTMDKIALSVHIAVGRSMSWCPSPTLQLIHSPLSLIPVSLSLLIPVQKSSPVRCASNLS